MVKNLGQMSIVESAEGDTDAPCKNTDREIWRKIAGDYYSPSIHITGGGGVGMNVGGYVIVMPVEQWHALACQT